MASAFCGGCGTPLPAGAAFCGRCGRSTTTAPEQRATATAVETENTAPVSPSTPAVAAENTAPVPPAEPVTYVPATPATTMPLDVEAAIRPRRRWTQTRLIILAIALGALVGVVVRVAWAASHRPPEPGELVAQLPIDPQGGTATFDNGTGKVSVPPGAVSKVETIKIYKRVINEQVRAVPPTGGQALIFPAGTLVTYVFGPVTIRLNLPITITLPIPPGQRGIVFVTARGQIRFVPGTPVGRNVTIVLRSFNLNLPGAIVVRG